MKACGKYIRTKLGKPKGRCSRPFNHFGSHGNSLCFICCVKEYESKSSGLCATCRLKRDRLTARKNGVRPINYQRPGKSHTFRCGCKGILPKKGQQNKFAVWSGAKVNGYYRCRAQHLITCSAQAARNHNHTAIDPNTPHKIIRSFMNKTNCERCRKFLVWEFGAWKTPHLHHDHKTGKIYGFTHPECNTQALEREIEQLKNQIEKLKARINK